MQVTRQLDGPRKVPVYTIRRKGTTSTARSLPSTVSAAVMHPAVHARLRIGDRHDPHEQEADRVADAVMRMPRRGAGIPASSRTLPNATASRAGDRIQSLHGRGQPLPQPLGDFFSQRFGQDFSHVRIHTDEDAVDLAEAIQARAFAVGPDIVFGAGEFAPGTSSGRKLMAHELAHVVQHDDGTGVDPAAAQDRYP